jgi:hypothetical protein
MLHMAPFHRAMSSIFPAHKPQKRRVTNRRITAGELTAFEISMLNVAPMGAGYEIFKPLQ